MRQCAPLLASLLCRPAAAAAPEPTPPEYHSPVPSGMGVPLKRALMDTEWGQLHYAWSKNMDPSLHTLVLYHSNPHSMIEFREFLNDPLVKGKYNFILHDYFGCGASDDCLPPACGKDPYDEHPCVDAEEFVGLSIRILDKLNVQKNVVCLGHLKGASLAIECARQLGPRADAVFAMNALYFYPETVPIVINYTKHTMMAELDSDGAHFMDAWYQPSCAPCDFVNATYCGVWNPKTILQNEWKTVDRLRALGSQWQYLLMGLNYNGGLVNETAIATLPKRKYLGWGTEAIAMWEDDGFEGGKLADFVNQAWIRATGNTTTIDFIDGGSEGSMVQNASYYAKQLHKLLQ